MRAVTLCGTALLLLAGCGGGPTPTGTGAAGGESTVDDNGGGGSGGGGSGGGGSSGGGEGEYDWGLPDGDNSVGEAELDGYARLQRCDGAIAWLEERWADFVSPRNALLYMAGAHLCLGDTSGGRGYYDHAVSVYGLAGVNNWPNVCSVYRATESVLRQAPPEEFTCQGGTAPEWKWDETHTLRDNPFTFDVDESVPQASGGTETGTGESGGDGTDGTDGSGTGENGEEEGTTDGTDGTEGTDGTDGTEGTAGTEGTDGTEGTAGTGDADGTGDETKPDGDAP